MPNVQFQRYPAQTVQNLWNRDQALLPYSNYFVATNPTPGTPIATTTSITSEDQTKPVLLLMNNWGVTDPNAKSIYPLYLKMLVSQVPTSATDWQMSVRLDNLATKYTSGGSAITPKNSNGGSSISTGALLYFGAVVAVTGSAAVRLVNRAQVNSAVPVTKDQWLITWGIASPSSDVISGGAGAKNINVPLGAVALQPGWQMAIQMWGGSNAAAPSWEFEFGYAEM